MNARPHFRFYLALLLLLLLGLAVRVQAQTGQMEEAIPTPGSRVAASIHQQM